MVVYVYCLEPSNSNILLESRICCILVIFLTRLETDAKLQARSCFWSVKQHMTDLVAMDH
jgi:hypothetical protein